MKFLAGFLLMTVAAPAFAQDVEDDPIRTLEQFNSRASAKSRVCKFQDSFGETGVCEACMKMLDWTRTVECKTLLAQSAPAWAKVQYLTNPPDFKKPFWDPIEKPFGPDWFPICSELILQNTAANTPLPFRPTQTLQGLQAAKDYMENLDTCDKTRRSAAANRFSQAYKSPTQESQQLRVMNPSERTAYRKKILSYFGDIQRQCCATDSGCNRMFAGIKLTFCEPQKDPKVSDPCIGQDHYSSMTGDGKIPFEFDPGSLSLSVYVDKKSGLSRSDPQTLAAHELGHACSNIQVKLALQNNDEDAMADLTSLMIRQSCDIGASAQRRYQAQASRLGFSKETSECVLNRANGARRTRFVPGECENGCPRMQIEEAYANLFSYTFAETISDFVPGRIPRHLCGAARDSFHPLMADIFGCMLSTPSFQAKIERVLECKK